MSDVAAAALKPPAEVKVGEHTYRIGKLDARRQFHVARRLGPVMAALTGDRAGGNAFNAFVAIANSISGMPDSEVDYVIDRCLAVCFRLDPADKTKSYRMMASNGAIMFNDLDMKELIELTSAVIEDNLLGFMSGLPESPSNGQATGSSS